MAGPVGPVSPRFWSNLARRSLSGADDAAAHLARLNVAARAQRPANMELGSPLFNRMYKADQAYEQLAKGRTANLRNAGGDFARIAGQAIRDENAAAAAARAGSPLDRALQVGPDGQLVAALLAGGMTAAGGGAVIHNAIEDRRKRQEEGAARSAAAVEALARQREADAKESRNQADLALSFDPIATEVYVSPDEMDYSHLAATSYPREPHLPMPYPYIDDLLEEDESPSLEDRYEALMYSDLMEGFDPVPMQSLPPLDEAFLRDSSSPEYKGMLPQKRFYDAMMALDQPQDAIPYAQGFSDAFTEADRLSEPRRRGARY